MCKQLKRPTRINKRKGAAIVEFAVVLPIIVVLVLGTIEATSMIFLQQSLKLAAYEGARTSIVPGAELENVEAACARVLEARRISATTIAVQPANFASEPYGTLIRVEVSAECDSNSFFPSWFYAERQSVAAVTFMKEV
jgi:Flp pilus assembly protein TadG